jgi:hypothetical protein
MTEERKIRYTSGCIYDIDLSFLVKKGKKQRVTKTIESDILGVIMTRKFIPFEEEATNRKTKKTYIKHYLVDEITGSMYDPVTGKCFSSTRLRIIGD